MKLYHGTDGRNIKRILRDGIHPRRRTKKNNWKHTVASNPDVIYLTTCYAGYFASLATSGFLFGILEIDTDKLDESLLRPDEDFLEQGSRKSDDRRTMNIRTQQFRDNLDDYAHLWKKSLEYLGTCSYADAIPPEAITRATTFDYRKNPYVTREVLEPTITLANFRFCADRYKTLTRWLAGYEDIDPQHLMSLPVGVVDQLPPDFREQIEQQSEVIREKLTKRDGLTVIK